MNKKTQIIISAVVAIILFVFIIASSTINEPDDAHAQYFCDVHPLSMSLDIDIRNDKNVVYNVSGEFFSKYEDNLVLHDLKGNAIREMDDSYNFIAQNDHAILNGNGILYSCEGEMNLIANSYKVFANNKKQVATVDFNPLQTSGVIRNMDGEIIARYDSNMMRDDYVVSIFDGCEIDDESVLMIFASYVSDIRSDV